MIFQDILGNEKAKGYLSKLLDSGMLPNVLLFHGPAGVGKGLFAQDVAKSLLYPMGSYPSDVERIISNNHPDYHLFYPEGKTGMHSIGSMKALMEDVYKTPFESNVKVFVIHDAERMLPATANALLKTLEEPPLDNFIILLSSKAEEIIATILSRCSKVNFTYLSEAQIVDFLETKMKKERLEAKRVAAIAHGSISRAIEIADNDKFSEKRVLLLNILSYTKVSNYAELMEELEGLCREEEDELAFETADFLFSQILMWYRDLNFLKEDSEFKGFYFADHLLLLHKQDVAKVASLEVIDKGLERARLGLNRNIKLKTCLEYFFLSINFI
jgi:DNA polymerase-3 subunit delta'